MNPPAQYLAFDLGASQARAILGTLGSDSFAMNVVHRFPTPLIEHNGHYFWDLDTIWAELQTGLKEALKISENLRSLSVSSWGVDYVPLDAEGKALRNPFSYRDNRTSQVLDEVHSIVSEADFFKITGINSMAINSIYQVYWDYKYDTELYRKTHSRLTIADFFNYLFSGRIAAEKSLASTTQILESESKNWSGTVLERLGLSANTFPELVGSSTVLGKVRGFPSIDVVASCSHDTACAAATVEALSGRENTAFLSSGTWSLLGMLRNKALLSDEAFRYGFTNELGADDSVRFLKNLTGLWVLQQCEKEWKEQGMRYTYEELMTEAETFADSNLVPTVDLSDAKFSEPGDMRRKLSESCVDAGFSAPESRGAQVAVILRSLAGKYAETIQQIREITHEPVDRIHIVGGGSQNQLLSRWTSELMGCKVLTGPVEATAIGNILLQAKAFGDVPDSEFLKTALSNL
jgi:rhamnulokinase